MEKTRPSQDEWRRVEEVYHEALEHRPESRAAFVIAACGGDSSLRREVESLLAADGANALVDQPAMDIAAELLDDGSIEIEFAYHNGDEVVLKAKRETSSTAC